MFLVLLALALPHPAGAACADAIKWRGQDYLGHRMSAHAGAKLADPAVVPACSDAGQHEPDTKEPVYRIKGIDPHIALTAGRTSLYVSNATFPELKSHPLHKRLHLTDKAPHRTGTACTVTGTAHPGYGTIVVRNRHGVTNVEVAVDTKISLQHAGTAYIPDGTEITARGLCVKTTLAATRISASR